jgi:predicted metal-dependent HD superfamily phosphohydrolase
MIKEILESVSFYKYFKGSVNDLYNCWNEPHRHFHTLVHLKNILDQIENDRNILSKYDYDVLRISAIYHDIVWLPQKDSINIKKSVEKFSNDFPNLPSLYRNVICTIIGSTEKHNFEDTTSKLRRLFNIYDMNGILNGNLETLIIDGDNVAKEFNMDIKIFNKKRIEFLEKYKKYNSNIEKCIEFLDNQ